MRTRMRIVLSALVVLALLFSLIAIVFVIFPGTNPG
jgi:hypothetical protein